MENQEANRHDYDSFLLRIWREPDSHEWRGWVQHVRSGQSLSVRDVNDLIAFLEGWSGKLARPPRKGLK